MPMLLQDIPIILSNLAIFISVAYALNTKRVIQGTFLAMTGIVSIIHHILWSLDGISYKLSVIRYYYNFLDYHHACLSIMVTVISVLKMDIKFEGLLITIVLVMYLTLNIMVSNFDEIDGNIGTIGEMTFSSKLLVITVTFAVCLSIVIIVFFVNKKIPRWDPIFLTFAFGFVILGTVSGFIANYSNYWIFHSLWHIFFMTSPYFIFRMVDNPNKTRQIYFKIRKMIRRFKLPTQSSTFVLSENAIPLDTQAIPTDAHIISIENSNEVIPSIARKHERVVSSFF